ncbi:MAG: CHASE3 domain-containing protein [Bacteroidetes bacterium]|nr:CHASE3 domain-containing protein [Bacteroidota bacterium]
MMDSLNKYIDLKLNYIDNIISLKRAGKEEEVKDLLTTGEGKFFMDKIREYNLALQESKEMLFSERKNITYSSLKESRTIFIREGILAIIITIFLAITIVSELNRRMRTEAQLVIKNQELERKNNEIEQFAYISAHDLQEPLRSISNFSVLLKEKLQANTDPGTNRYMDKIIAAASRMSNLINDLLEYSRLGKDMERTKINTARLVDEVVHDIGIIIKESGAKITIEKLPVVVGHQSLKSLFQNLITNSIKFTAKGTRPEIKISSTQNQTEFVFSISDNGIGIDPQYFERIFTIFQRLHTREDYPGTGIGLAQCKKIVELHGGRIWVTSKPDNGSTFYFTISKNQKL